MHKLNLYMIPHKDLWWISSCSMREHLVACMAMDICLGMFDGCKQHQTIL
jgi:hypothetical protein